MSESTKKLTVWLISDGRPGHYNQSKGIAKALEFLRPVELHWLEVDLRAGFFRLLLKNMLNSTNSVLPNWVLWCCYRLPEMPANNPDIIISAGGKTSFLNAALARQFGCRNLFAGSLRGLSDLLFTAVLTLEPIPGSQKNVVVDLAPTIIDPQEVKIKGDLYRHEKGFEDYRLWAMLVGGDGAGYLYNDQYWICLAKGMDFLSEKYGVKWLLTTSRRTGRHAESILQRELSAENVSEAVWYGQEQKKVMQEFLGASEVVFCSEDSMSMLTEAIAAAKPVCSLRPVKASPGAKYQNVLSRFVEHGWLTRKIVSNFGLDKSELSLFSLTPLEGAVSQKIALQLNEILKLKI